MVFWKDCYRSSTFILHNKIVTGRDSHNDLISAENQYNCNKWYALGQVSQIYFKLKTRHPQEADGRQRALLAIQLFKSLINI